MTSLLVSHVTDQASGVGSKVGNSESVDSDSMSRVDSSLDSSRPFIHRVVLLESTESVAIANP